MEQNINNIVIYQDENGVTKVNARFANDDVWLSQQQLAEIYDTTQQKPHISRIYFQTMNYRIARQLTRNSC